VQAFNLILNKEHLTMEGLAKLVAIKASINLGLSSELKDAFPNIVPVSKPKIINQNISDPLWVAGFTTGEGCFYINLPKSVSHKLKERVQLVFKLTQHFRDEQLMSSLMEFLGSGNVYRDKEVIDLKVTKLSDINSKIIPLFVENPIEGAKSKEIILYC